MSTFPADPATPIADTVGPVPGLPSAALGQLSAALDVIIGQVPGTWDGFTEAEPGPLDDHCCDDCATCSPAHPCDDPGCEVCGCGDPGCGCA